MISGMLCSPDESVVVLYMYVTHTYTAALSDKRMWTDNMPLHCSLSLDIPLILNGLRWSFCHPLEAISISWAVVCTCISFYKSEGSFPEGLCVYTHFPVFGHTIIERKLVHRFLFHSWIHSYLHIGSKSDFCQHRRLSSAAVQNVVFCRVRHCIRPLQVYQTFRSL